MSCRSTCAPTARTTTRAAVCSRWSASVAASSGTWRAATSSATAPWSRSWVYAASRGTAVIEPGTRVPDCSVPDHDGNDVSLSDFAGRKLVLAFYPLDFSPVCTDQLGLYQEVLGEIEAQGASLVGISVDSSYCHHAFREQLNLTMPLLADFHPKAEVSKAYGAYIEGAGISNRSLVLIEDGEVKWAYAAPNPGEIPGANLIFDAISA